MPKEVFFNLTDEKREKYNKYLTWVEKGVT